MYMNTISRSFEKVVAPVALVVGLNACGAAPVQPKTYEQEQAELAAASQARTAQIQKAVTACTNQFPSAVGACKQVPDSEYPYSKETGRLECVVNARTALVACLTNAAEPAIAAGDTSNCASIGTANFICEKAFPGAENQSTKVLCEGDIDDARRTCTGERNAPIE